MARSPHETRLDSRAVRSGRHDRSPGSHQTQRNLFILSFGQRLQVGGSLHDRGRPSGLVLRDGFFFRSDATALERTEWRPMVQRAATGNWAGASITREYAANRPRNRPLLARVFGTRV